MLDGGSRQVNQSAWPRGRCSRAGGPGIESDFSGNLNLGLAAISPLTGFLKGTFPADFPPKPADARLRSNLDQQAQSGLDRRPLRARPAALHGLLHQTIINIDASAHRSGLPMCRDTTSMCIRRSRFSFPPRYRSRRHRDEREPRVPRRVSACDGSSFFSREDPSSGGFDGELQADGLGYRD